MKKRYRILSFLAVVLIGAGAALWWFLRPLPVLTVTTWAGDYGRAQASALMRPYAAEKSVDVRLAQWDGDLAEVARAVRTHQYTGDVIDFELPKAVEACRHGLLEKIDPTILPPGRDGTLPARDFVMGAIGPCYVGNVVYSQVMIAASGLARTPATVADFFDTDTFPGRRVLLGASAKFNLEMALLADGVAARDVYKTLATPQGQARAFAKLKALNPIWAQDSVDAIAKVQSGQAVMATALNGAVFDAAQKGFHPTVLWDHQLYEMDVFAIPAGNPNRKRAQAFIAYATASQPLARMANWVPYGPARRSALAFVTANPETGQAMRQWLPTAPANFTTAFAIDDGWWLDHGNALESRWQGFIHP